MEDQRRIQIIGLLTIARDLYKQQEQIKDSVAAVAGEKLDGGYGLASDYVYGGDDPVMAADGYLAALKAHPEYTIEGKPAVKPGEPKC